MQKSIVNNSSNSGANHMYVPQRNSLVSRVRNNRAYLISQTAAKDLNTYRNFGLFHSFTDIYIPHYRRDGSEDKEGHKVGVTSVRSIFNRSGAMAVGGENSNDYANVNLEQASEWRISNNVPLVDSPYNRQQIRSDSGCTVKELVNLSSAGRLGREIYSYADFMYCKYLGQVSNNYLITLRRFPIPPGDYISSIGTVSKTDLEGQNLGGQSIGCMVTWLGTPGNEINNILKYSYKMPYRSQDAQWETVNNGDADSSAKWMNSIAAACDPAYRKAYTQGYGGAALGKFNEKFFGFHENGPYNLAQYAQFQDRTKIYGPIDRVKSVYMRGAQGLEFNQEISLTFEYELRAYNGINTRQAMLDLLSNILNVTYSTGDFWGGAYHASGMHQSSIFNNMKIFKVSGGFTDFVDAFNQDVTTLTKSAGDSFRAEFGDLSNPKNIVKAFKAALNSIGGMILGGLLNKFGRPQKAYANSLLTDRPVGLWHLTIGNPNHPIVSMGNMIIQSCSLEHNGALGLDDFPTGIKVVVGLVHGKPRDIREIERMYMHGNDRIYSTMGPMVASIYSDAAVYQKSHKKATTAHSKETQEVSTAFTQQTPNTDKAQFTNENTNTKADDGTSNTEKMEAASSVVDQMTDDEKLMVGIPTKNVDEEGNILAGGNFIQKWYGERDHYSITFQSSEQEFGSSRRPGKDTKDGPKGDTPKSTSK